MLTSEVTKASTRLVPDVSLLQFAKACNCFWQYWRYKRDCSGSYYHSRKNCLAAHRRSVVPVNISFGIHPAVITISHFSVSLFQPTCSRLVLTFLFPPNCREIAFSARQINFCRWSWPPSREGVEFSAQLNRVPTISVRSTRVNETLYRFSTLRSGVCNNSHLSLFTRHVRIRGKEIRENDGFNYNANAEFQLDVRSRINKVASFAGHCCAHR